jgi:arylsulfatase A-like enzyme
MPALLDANHAENETLFWERLGNEAVREGSWKLVRYYSDIRDYNNETKRGPGSGMRTGRWELYNLDQDTNEQQDLAVEQPERVAELVAKHQAWAKRVGVIPREEIAKKIAAESAP